MRRAMAALQSPSKPTVPVPEVAAALRARSSEPACEVKELSETDHKLNELWRWFDSLKPPSAAQMDELLEALLALPPETTEWNEVLQTCTQAGQAIDRAARVACETSDPQWTRALFDLVTGDIRESGQARQDCLRLYDTLLRVSREAWRIDGLPPGWAFVALSRLAESVYRAQNRSEPKRKKIRKGQAGSRAGNLLDSLNPSGMEERIARACPDLLGVNVARAQILVDAHSVLLDFASRKGWIEDGAAAATRAELVRLSNVLSVR